MIQIENLTYHYPDSIEAALRSINLTIKSGEIVAVMGANGSGKSTFAKILSKIIKPDRGSIKLGDDNNSSSVGFVFQNPDNQIVALTVEKELAFGLENLGCPLDEMERRISETLNEFELISFRNRIISDLSGGEKQRVAVASVMITQPEILIFDEPDSFLDYHGKQLLLEQIKKIRKTNPNIIIIHITQYIETAKQYPRMLLFSQGELIADNNPIEIFSNNTFLSNSGLIYEKRNFNIGSLVQAKKGESKTLVVENLSFQYNEEKKLLHNISFSFSQGEVLAITGNSGSGKSTLASLLCGLIPPNSGNIEIIPLVEKQELSSVITMLFQQPEKQFFLQTVEKEISFGLKNKKLEFSNQKILDIMKLVGLDFKKLALRNPQTLSGGEKRRLAFAVILALSYDFIIFDEPTCGLDPQGVGMFAELVENQKLLHNGVIIVSHDFELIKSVADKVIYIQTDGSAESVSKHHFLESNFYRQMLQNQKKIDFFS